jgi:NADPH-dependent curcumin reductase CurA
MVRAVSQSDSNHVNQAVRVLRRATGIPGPDIFEIVSAPMPDCPEGGMVLRVLQAGVDPAMRGWLSAEKNYMTVPDGAVMRALCVGEVVQSQCADWPVGRLAYGWMGWCRFAAVLPSDLLWAVDTDLAPPSAWLNIFGLNGLTAWLGLLHFGRPRPGDTVLVTTAAGAVGAVVGQLAAAHGLRAVGLTSTAEKVARATTHFGYDAAIDYRAAEVSLADAVAASCPHGIDIFFDNTGGWLADAAFGRLNTGARVVQCGTASVATWLPPPMGPRRERDMLVKRLSWQGFVAFDHTALFPAALAELRALYEADRLVSHDDVLHGLEHAPGAIQRLYHGENQGRLSIVP